VTLANNHLLDCGRAGVVETLRAVAGAGLIPIGAGLDAVAAHAPAIVRTRGGTVGVLGYYWNRRCAVTDKHPGSAMDDAASLAADIGVLRASVDLVLITIHWGIPYEREPAQADREKARLAIDCGADLVVAHHPHVVQPFEVYRQRPIFYSVGNFAFGSGNTHAEGLLIGARVCEEELVVEVFPLYVKNRDPRVAYQPKLLRGHAAERVLRNLAQISGDSGRHLAIESWRGVLRLPLRRQV
jgi:poly-gamma-glutamate capsule biosynthesis protein CapA/YwtB (metallophosphatase superfamily)